MPRRLSLPTMVRRQGRAALLRRPNFHSPFPGWRFAERQLRPTGEIQRRNISAAESAKRNPSGVSRNCRSSRAAQPRSTSRSISAAHSFAQIETGHALECRQTASPHSSANRTRRFRPRVAAAAVPRGILSRAFPFPAARSKTACSTSSSSARRARSPWRWGPARNTNRRASSSRCAGRPVTWNV